MKNKAYDALADWFEYLNDDCGYEQWSQYLLSLLSNYGAGKKGLDIGCGSGYFTRQLYKAGYDVTGVDCSARMLSAAQETGVNEGLSIPYILGDITALKATERVDFAVAINDCLNYVPQEKLLTAFKKVHSALKKDGLFFFDVSSEKKLTSLPPVSIDDREDVTYIAFNRLEEERVIMDVSLFVKREGEKNVYTRADETHVQYIYGADEILFALTLAGFETLFYSGHLGEEKEESDRLEFLVRRT